MTQQERRKGMLQRERELRSVVNLTIRRLRGASDPDFPQDIVPLTITRGVLQDWADQLESALAPSDTAEAE